MRERERRREGERLRTRESEREKGREGQTEREREHELARARRIKFCGPPISDCPFLRGPGIPRGSQRELT